MYILVFSRDLSLHVYKILENYITIKSRESMSFLVQNLKKERKNEKWASLGFTHFEMHPN
jgi:hypothetical protein